MFAARSSRPALRAIESVKSFSPTRFQKYSYIQRWNVSFTNQPQNKTVVYVPCPMKFTSPTIWKMSFTRKPRENGHPSSRLRLNLNTHSVSILELIDRSRVIVVEMHAIYCHPYVVGSSIGNWEKSKTERARPVITNTAVSIHLLTYRQHRHLSLLYCKNVLRQWID